MRDGVPRLGTARRAVDFERIRFIQVRFKRTTFSRKPAFHDRLITFLGFVPASLQRLLRCRGLRENHEARGFPVETMHDPNAIAACPLPCRT